MAWLRRMRSSIVSHCPNCKKPSAAAHAPFCSARCRDVDLNRWFTGAYATPAVELDDVSEEDLEALLEHKNPHEF